MSTYYTSDLMWADWVNQLTAFANAVMNDIQQGYEWYEKFAALTYGLSNAQILALPAFAGRTAADVTAMQYAWGVFNDLYNALNNVSALTQANREGYLVPFLS
jgi:hypothetical protein